MYHNLSRLAKRHNESMAQIARELIAEGLKNKQARDTSGKTMLRRILKIQASGGPEDLSTNMNAYVYGEKA